MNSYIPAETKIPALEYMLLHIIEETTEAQEATGNILFLELSDFYGVYTLMKEYTKKQQKKVVPNNKPVSDAQFYLIQTIIRYIRQRRNYTLEGVYEVCYQYLGSFLNYISTVYRIDFYKLEPLLKCANAVKMLSVEKKYNRKVFQEKGLEHYIHEMLTYADIMSKNTSLDIIDYMQKFIKGEKAW
jgi:hypothetical protein